MLLLVVQIGDNWPVCFTKPLREILMRKWSKRQLTSSARYHVSAYIDNHSMFDVGRDYFWIYILTCAHNSNLSRWYFAHEYNLKWQKYLFAFQEFRLQETLSSIRTVKRINFSNFKIIRILNIFFNKRRYIYIKKKIYIKISIKRIMSFEFGLNYSAHYSILFICIWKSAKSKINSSIINSSIIS